MGINDMILKNHFTLALFQVPVLHFPKCRDEFVWKILKCQAMSLQLLNYNHLNFFGKLPCW